MVEEGRAVEQGTGGAGHSDTAGHIRDREWMLVEDLESGRLEGVDRKMGEKKVQWVGKDGIFVE